MATQKAIKLAEHILGYEWVFPDDVPSVAAMIDREAALPELLAACQAVMVLDDTTVEEETDYIPRFGLKASQTVSYHMSPTQYEAVSIALLKARVALDKATH